jgi:hypothetical protein
MRDLISLTSPRGPSAPAHGVGTPGTPAGIP